MQRCLLRSMKRAWPNPIASGSKGTSTAGSRGRKGRSLRGCWGPLEHDHFFTADGAFGSHDQNGEEVDGGDFELVDGDTVSFPSHAEEFGYDGDLVVDYTVSGDVVVRSRPARPMRRHVRGCLRVGTVRLRLRSVGAR